MEEKMKSKMKLCIEKDGVIVDKWNIVIEGSDVNGKYVLIHKNDYILHLLSGKKLTKVILKHAKRR
jgi:hypothetical protein